MTELDVGCGTRKMGDINVDIDRKVKPDIICDIHHLPFRNNQFCKVYCYHVLEHETVNPEKAIKELLRVTREILEIQVPHWLSRNAKKDPTHRNFHIMHLKYWKKWKPIKTQIEWQYLIPPFILRPNNITITIKRRNKIE